MNFFERWRSLQQNKTKEELDAHYKSMELEKGDLLKMIIAGFVTFGPLLLVVILISFVMLLLFRAI